MNQRSYDYNEVIYSDCHGVEAQVFTHIDKQTGYVINTFICSQCYKPCNIGKVANEQN